MDRVRGVNGMSSVKPVPCPHLCLLIVPPPFFSSIVILYLRFGAQVLQDNFVAELSTHYQNYILSMGSLLLQDHALHGGVSVSGLQT